MVVSNCDRTLNTLSNWRPSICSCLYWKKTRWNSEGKVLGLLALNQKKLAIDCLESFLLCTAFEWLVSDLSLSKSISVSYPIPYFKKPLSFQKVQVSFIMRLEKDWTDSSIAHAFPTQLLRYLQFFSSLKTTLVAHIRYVNSFSSPLSCPKSHELSWIVIPF